MTYKWILLLSLFLMSLGSTAQSSISLEAGWTVSQLRRYDIDTFQPGPVFDELNQYPPLHAPYIGITYQWTHKNLCLSTGISMMTMGSSRMPFATQSSWPTYYWTIPLLIGYQWELANQWQMTIEGGFDIGFQQGSSGLIGSGTYWGNIGAALGAEIRYRRYQLGMRGHWGVTNFRVIGPLGARSILRHTALTTYIGYMLWDQRIVKTRRSEKQQATSFQ